MTLGTDSSEPWTDRAWLQEALRDLERDASLSIIDHHVEDEGNKGEHYLSDMCKINVRVQRAGYKQSEMFMIAKTEPTQEFMKKALTGSTAFPNEIKIFSQVLPQYHSMLEAVDPGNFKPFAARHIYSQNKLPYILLVSDLAPEGFRMAKRQEGLDLDHCLLVMKTLGRLHAASLALHEKDPELVESFKENAYTEQSSVEWVNKASEASVSSVAQVVQTWPDGGDQIASRLLKVYKKFSKQFQEMYLTQGNRLNVLLHGDMWINNFLFKYNDVTGKVEDMRMVDFQLACYTSCAIDLQYFMYTSPKDEVRISHTEDLLKEYHCELCSTLKLLGHSEKAIRFQELLEEYDRKGLLGFMISVYCLPGIMSSRENSNNSDEIQSGPRESAATGETDNKQGYWKVIKRLLPLFMQKGYF